MTEVTDPPKIPFSQLLRDSLPNNAQTATKTDNATSETIPTGKGNVEAVPAATKTEAKSLLASATTDDDARRDAEIKSGKASPKSTDWDRKERAVEAANKRAEELKAKHASAEKELGELRKTPKHNAELIKSIEAERDELKAKWNTVRARFDPKFRADNDAKIGAVITRIKDDVPAERLNDLTQVFQMPSGERKRKIMAELTEDLDPPTVTKIMLADERIGDILAAQKKELEDSDTILKTSAEQDRKQADERKTAHAKSFDTVLAKSKEGDAASPLYQLREGDDAETKTWNAGVVERSAVARKGHFDEFDSAEDKAEFSLNAAAYPAALSVIKDLQTENASLKETLGKMQSTSPGIRSSSDKGGAVAKSFTQEMMERAM